MWDAVSAAETRREHTAPQPGGSETAVIAAL